MATLSALLSDHMTEAHLTQEELGRRLGTTQQRVGGWLSGRRPQEEMWPKLQALLELSEDELKASMPSRNRHRRRASTAPSEYSTSQLASVSQLPAAPEDAEADLTSELVRLKRENRQLLRMVRDLAGMAGRTTR